MARIYHPKDQTIFQRKEGGPFYSWLKGQEICLDTSNPKQARENRDYHLSLISRFGASAFKHTFGAVFPLYIKDLRKSKRRRSSYIDSLEWVWTKYLEPFWGKRRLMDYHQLTWDQYCASISKKFKVNDFNNHRGTISGVLSWGQRRRLIASVSTVENPFHEPRHRKRLKPEHVRSILLATPTVQGWRAPRKPAPHPRSIPGGLRLFLALYLFHGSRRGENIKLKWSDIDFEKRAIFLRAEVVKTNEARTIPINSLVLALLLERQSLFETMAIKSPWVFPNRRDFKKHMDVSGFKTVWKKVVIAAGLEKEGYTWHDFRATFESYMDSASGFNETQREKMSGAARAVRSKKYVDLTEDDLRGLEEVVQIPGLMESLENKGAKK